MSDEFMRAKKELAGNPYKDEAQKATPFEDVYGMLKARRATLQEEFNNVTAELDKLRARRDDISDAIFLIEGALERSTPLSKMPQQTETVQPTRAIY